MSVWTIVWIFWGLAFAGIEIPGIVLNKDLPTKDFRTLTENLRWLFATDKAGARTRYRAIRRTALLAGVGWLAAHLIAGWV